MPTGYCERDDVRRVLREASFNGDLGQDGQIVDDAIAGQTEWLRKRTRRHWFDTSGGTTLVPTSTRSVTNITLDVPSSPHRQDRQLLRSDQGVRYPVTHAGRYVKVRLPHYDVSSLTTLDVRQTDGDVEDWVAAGDKTQGRGDDYYLLTDGDTGASHLYLNASSIGARIDFGDLLTLDYDYGVDGVPETVRRATALRAAAELVLDDDAAVGIPDNGQLVAAESKADKFRKQADRLLQPYLETPIA